MPSPRSGLLSRPRRAAGWIALAASLLSTRTPRAATAEDGKPPPAPPPPAGAPPAAAPASPEAQALIEKARAAVSRDPAEALGLYFRAIRAGEDYGTKYLARDEVLAMAPVPAKPPSGLEQDVVAARITEERERDVGRKADELERKGMPLAARDLHQRIRGLQGLAEGKDDEHAKAIERIEASLVDEPTEAERVEARAACGDPIDPTKAILAGHAAAASGKPRVAVRIWKIAWAADAATAKQKEECDREVAALRKKTIEGITPEERAAAREVWEDPHWKGLATSGSHQFLFIGAKSFVDSITAADRIRLDLACVLLGDLVGRDLVASARHRLTVYYKERFDFGGGVASGMRIDIGNKAIAKPVAGPLHYHELSHCVFDLGMIYPGFVEGIANFGAVFALDALGRHEEADVAIKTNRDSYRDDWSERRIRWWRIPSYQPSCGFLLSPITAKDPEARKAEWAKYRRFFRALRAHPIEEPRDAERIRPFVARWSEVFGPGMVDAAAKARFPVTSAVLTQVPAEEREWAEHVRLGEQHLGNGFLTDAAGELEAVVKGWPGTELGDRATFSLAQVRAQRGDAVGAADLYRALGCLATWKLCGPFYARHGDGFFVVYDPERRIELNAEYKNTVQNAVWKDAKCGPDGVVDLLQQGYAYPDDAAVYALAYVEVPADAPDATVFTGFDDFAALWVDGELVERWDQRVDWLFDRHTAPVPLTAGRHRFLFKVQNRRAPWAFSARVVHADRTPIAGLKVVPPPARDVPAPPADVKPQTVFKEDFSKTKEVSKRRWRPTAGSWVVDKDALRRDKPGSVAWRKFFVQPYYDRDAPSGLIWLEDKDLAGLETFSVDVLLTRPDDAFPKFAVTVHGEGRDDGLSGHTLILRAGGEGVEARLEEYDRLVYWGTAPIPKGTSHLVTVTRRGRALSCLVDGKPLLDGVDLPPLPRSGIGLMTWDRETGVARVHVDRPKPP
jgi:hypothetical protein